MKVDLLTAFLVYRNYIIAILSEIHLFLFLVYLVLLMKYVLHHFY